MENKELEQEENTGGQEQDIAEGAQKPVDDGFSLPPEKEEVQGVPVLEEPQEAPIAEEAPQVVEEQPAAPVEEAPQEPQWQDVSSHNPAAEQPVPPPTAWPGQTGEIPLHGWPGQPYAPPAGQMPSAAPYGQGYYAGYPYYGYPPQPGVQPGAQQGGQPAPVQGQPPYTGYYPGYPAAYAPYGGPYPQQPVQAGIQQKKKKPLGLKILLWVVSILAVGSLVGFGVFLALQWNPSSRIESVIERVEPVLPNEAPKDRGEDKEDAPPEEDTEPEDLPNVDLTPNTDGIKIQPRPDGDTLEPEELYDQVVKSTVAVTVTLTRDGQTAQSRGTGIIATADGYIITNAHVVLNSKSSRVKVSTYDGQEYDAVVVGIDRTTDLAVIKTNDYGFTPATFGDAEELSMGEWVMALGNPGGTKYANSLTRGIVSGLNREAGQYSLGGMTYIQTDAAINPGNSGGPLVNMYGQVVGINSSKIVTENYEGMGFAIPVSQAQPIINELLSGGYIKGRTRLGIMILEIDEQTAMMYQIPAGLQITQINEDSAFIGTDAQVGDIITALDGEPIYSLRDVSELLSGHAPGDKVRVTLYRPSDSGSDEDYEFTVTVTLLEDKGETQE